MKGPAATHERLRISFQESCEAVRRARARATAAASQARLIKAALQNRPAASAAPDMRAKLAHAVAAESARLMDERNRIIAVVSHELRQPLSAALAALQLLQAAKAEDATARARGVLVRQLQQMTRLLDDLLDMSRLSVRSLRIHKTRVDLHPIIEDAVETIAHGARERGIAVVVDVEPVTMPVAGDGARLQQILGNLLSNAVRYTPEGGRVTLTVRRRDSRFVLVVADTGRGIEREDLATVFDPFFQGQQSDPEGLGIGLSLVKGLAELHGGFVTADSPGSGQGATFTVVLPLAGDKETGGAVLE